MLKNRCNPMLKEKGRPYRGELYQTKHALKYGAPKRKPRPEGYRRGNDDHINCQP